MFQFPEHDNSRYQGNMYETIHGVRGRGYGYPNRRQDRYWYNPPRESHVKEDREDYEEEVYPKSERRAYDKFPEERYEERYPEDEVYEDLPDHDYEYKEPKTHEYNTRHSSKDGNSYSNDKYTHTDYDERYHRPYYSNEKRDYEPRYGRFHEPRKEERQDDDMMKEVVDTMKKDPDMKVVVTKKGGRRVIEMKKPGVETIIEEEETDSDGKKPGEKVHGKTMKKTNVHKNKDGEVTRETKSMKYSMVSTSDEKKDVEENLPGYKPRYPFGDLGFPERKVQRPSAYPTPYPVPRYFTFIRPGRTNM